MKRLLMALIALGLSAGFASAQDMAGCYVDLLGPMTANPGDTVTFSFYVYNGSVDGEGTVEVQFRFPDTFNVQGGSYDDGGAGWLFDFSVSGEYDQYAHFIDADGGEGEIQPGNGGTFEVTVYVSTNTDCGSYNIHWKQYGDEVGEPQHWIGGDLPIVICYVASEPSAFSAVKALY